MKLRVFLSHTPEMFEGYYGPRALAALADHAEVIAAFDAGGEGRVRWQGQSWAALNLDPSRSPGAGSRVTVMGREGTRLRVLPAPPALTDDDS
jgi:membrane-bound ClpP family serine protease